MYLSCKLFNGTKVNDNIRCVYNLGRYLTWIRNQLQSYRPVKWAKKSATVSHIGMFSVRSNPPTLCRSSLLTNRVPFFLLTNYADPPYSLTVPLILTHQPCYSSLLTNRVPSFLLTNRVPSSILNYSDPPYSQDVFPSSLLTNYADRWIG